MKILPVGVTVALLAILAVPGTGQEVAPTQQSCLASNCHAYRMAFQDSPHSVLDTEGLAERADADFSCAACHGPFGEREREDGQPGCEFEVFGFQAEQPPSPKTARCLGCHGGEMGGFPSSEHALAGLDCTGCHDIHGPNRGRWPLQRFGREQDGSLSGPNPSAPCRRCHGDVFQQFESTERHRLQEGIVLCTACHDPHEPQGRWRLGGFKDQACLQCHADKGGPFVFEHGSVRVEGCTACHTPHGSPNRHLLTFDRVAELCFSCHVAVPGFHARFTADSQCTSCHYRIHGSNLDPAFLR